MLLPITVHIQMKWCAFMNKITSLRENNSFVNNCCSAGREPLHAEAAEIPAEEAVSDSKREDPSTGGTQ